MEKPKIDRSPKSLYSLRVSIYKENNRAMDYVQRTLNS